MYILAVPKMFILLKEDITTLQEVKLYLTQEEETENQLSSTDFNEREAISSDPDVLAVNESTLTHYIESVSKASYARRLTNAGFFCLIPKCDFDLYRDTVPDNLELINPAVLYFLKNKYPATFIPEHLVRFYTPKLIQMHPTIHSVYTDWVQSLQLE